MKRAFLLATAFTPAVLLALHGLSSPVAAPEPLSALQRLAEGNRRFAAGEPLRAHQSLERRSSLAGVQAPFAVVVGCADSRVPPELVFDQGLGDLYVIRCAGGLLGDAAIGSIEYAVDQLGCDLVVVLAHERCDAVATVLRGERLPGHLAAFVPPIDPVLSEARRRGGDVLDTAIRASAERTARELRSSEPILAPAIRAGRLVVVTGRYDLDTGLVSWSENVAVAGL